MGLAGRGDSTSAVTVPLLNNPSAALAAHAAVAATSRAGLPAPPPCNRSEVEAGLCLPLRHLAAFTAAFLAFDHPLAATFGARGFSSIGRHRPASPPRVSRGCRNFVQTEPLVQGAARVHRVGNARPILPGRADAASTRSLDGDFPPPNPLRSGDGAGQCHQNCRAYGTLAGQMRRLRRVEHKKSTRRTTPSACCERCSRVSGASSPIP